MNIIATGKNSHNCLEDDCNPAADSYLRLPSIYNPCLEDDIMKFQKGNCLRRGAKLSEETKNKMSAAHIGQRVSEETRKKISQKLMGVKKENPPWNKGKKGVQKGWNKGLHWSEEHRKKLSEAHKGKRHSEETLKKMSESRKGHPAYNKGMPAWNRGLRYSNPKLKGRKISDEWRKKMSEAHMGEKWDEERRKNHSDENAPNWRGGISFEPYCPKFNTELKEKIRERDGRTCQLCGVKENGRKLAVHHIHYDKPNCHPDLIALCISCNNKVNFNRDYYENLFMQNLRRRGMI